VASRLIPSMGQALEKSFSTMAVRMPTRAAPIISAMLRAGVRSFSLMNTTTINRPSDRTPPRPAQSTTPMVSVAASQVRRALRHGGLRAGLAVAMAKASLRGWRR